MIGDTKIIRWHLANPFAIAGTGKRVNGHSYRRPRNIAIKRSLIAFVDTLRGVKQPPSDWDDINIAAYGHRTWKRHRTTQWREQV